MIKRLKLHRPSHTTVVAYLSLFLVVSGGAALAASQLHKNSVGAKQIKKNAVIAAKIKNGAVTGNKLADNAVTASKIAGEAVTTGKIANNSLTTGKLANGAVTTGKLGDSAVTTGKLAGEAVTTGKIANDAVTGAKVNEGTLRFTCNNPADAIPILGGPCLYKRTTSGSTWEEAIQTCQVGVPGATLPTVAQVEAYARLGGVPWKEMVAFTSDLAGTGPGAPSGAWSVQTDANGNVTVILATPLTSKTQTTVLCEYDPATDPTPGS